MSTAPRITGNMMPLIRPAAIKSGVACQPSAPSSSVITQPATVKPTISHARILSLTVPLRKEIDVYEQPTTEVMAAHQKTKQESTKPVVPAPALNASKTGVSGLSE